MSKEELVAFLNDMIDALTWGRVALLTLLGALIVSTLIVFENRTTIFNRLLGPTPVEQLNTPWEVSQQSRDELTALTKQPLISGVVLTEVDLKKNRRITKFWHVREVEVRQEVAPVVATLLPQPFFDSDKLNNEQMLAVLSNQFGCTPTSQTIFNRIFPSLHQKYPFVCRLAVPPFTGEFAGLITVLLVRQPTQAEVDALKIELTRVSVELYLRDIQNRGKK